MSQFPDFDVRNPYLRANSLAELTAWEDLDFIRCAYVTLLGRQPDSSGQAHYAEMMRAGYSKLQILWHMRTSEEAAAHDPGIAGLDRALKRATLERRRFAGLISRLLRSNADRSSPRDRTLRALEVAAFRQERAMSALREQVGMLALRRPSEVDSPEAIPELEMPTSKARPSRKLIAATPELNHLRRRNVRTSGSMATSHD